MSQRPPSRVRFRLSQCGLLTEARVPCNIFCKLDKHTSIAKGTKEALKLYNFRMVLTTLVQQDQISRAEISRITRLSRATVSEIVARLIEDGYVSEGRRDNKRGGKPSILLELNPASRVVASLDLSAPKLRGALVDLKGSVLFELSLPFGDQRDASDVLARISELVTRLLDAAPVSVVGIGLGCPGLVNPHEGALRLALNQGWENLQLGSVLEERFGLPTRLMNDHTAAALGEYVFGEKTHGPNLALIRYIDGIGLGLVLEGIPFFGDDFSSGEIGHVVVEPNGELCDCGNRGCLEKLVGGRAIATKARKASHESRPDLFESFSAMDDRTLMDELLGLLAAGDSFPRPFYDEIATRLGDVLATMQGVLNINEVVLSGPLPTSDQQFTQKLRSEVARRILPEMSQRVRVSHSRLGEDIVLIGTAAYVLSTELGIYETSNHFYHSKTNHINLGGVPA